MKTRSKCKTPWVVATLISLSAFLFVNLHAGFGLQKNQTDQVFVQTDLEEDAQNEEGKIAPYVTVLQKLIETAQKLITQQH
jgi:hypothetical protein